ncbi:hypothetical protein L9F63_004144 [Diploptera punctata]|uniref:Baculoviral IAP repeat-containing protein 5 n=1 Tax=Diploptera punctata TaxID=6984 RepID=A0AAD7ZGX8_DIPPU|nr:hypothetical protein L9F63_004144 [Diploptera punctata]
MLTSKEMENEQIPHPTQYVYEIQRLKSFNDWPYDVEDCICTSKKMAEAGFFFCGSNKEPDLVQCFVCLKKLDGWEPEDDPWDEHRKHASKCPFVEIGKKQSKLTYPQQYKILKEAAVNMLKYKHNTLKTEADQNLKKSRTFMKKNRK